MVEHIVRELRSKGWARQEGVLDPEHLERINGYFNFHHSEFRPAKVGPKDKRVRQVEIRGDHTFWLDPQNPPDVFAPLIDFLDELKRMVNSRLFLGLKEFECHLAYYEAGSFYKKHSDRHSKDSSRSLSFVFYLNEQWSEDDGGELVLYHQDGTVLEKILPRPGAFVSFLSEDFPHEVLPAKRERRSLTGWMHSKIIY